MIEYFGPEWSGTSLWDLPRSTTRDLEPFVCCIHESTNVQEMLLLFDAVNDSCKSGEVEVE